VFTFCLYCVFIVAENSVKSTDKEHVWSSAEHNTCDEKDHKGSFQPRQMHASQKKQKSCVMNVLTSDTVVPNSDAIVTRQQKQEMQFRCSFCEKKFRTKSGHRKHELYHKGELPQCTMCGGRFVDLKSHALMHCADRKQVCSVCKQAFYRASSFRKHMLVHTGERQYTCQDCGGWYKSFCHLKKHILSVHTHEKNRVCSVCGKVFSDSNLRAHMLVHRNKRPYHRKTCNKGFKQKHTQVPQLTGDTVVPIIQEIAPYKHDLIEPGTSEGSYRCGNIECSRCDGKDSLRPCQNDLLHASEKQHKSCMKNVSTSDCVVPNSDANVTRQQFAEPCSSQGTFGCENRENILSEVPHLKGDTEVALFKHDLIQPVTSGDLRTCELPEMSRGADLITRPQCTVCGFMFKCLRNLERHMTIHTGVKPFQCSFCDKKFREKYWYEMHVLGHKGQLPQCPVCGGRYARLAEHLPIHSMDNYNHICSVCKRAFRQASTLKRHMLVHTGERRYTCQDCGGWYKTSSSLKKHIRSVHAKEKNHVCSMCGKVFSGSNHLQDHRLVHTNERPYHCETCNKAFKTKFHLDVHRSVHSSEKLFVCSTCGKCLSQYAALKRHSLIHSGEQPYECSVCKMRFNQSSSMQRHMLVHTGEKPYSCSDCGTRFTQSGGLASHRLRHCPRRKNTDS